MLETLPQLFGDIGGLLIVLLIIVFCIGILIFVGWGVKTGRLFGKFPVTAFIFEERGGAIIPAMKPIDKCRAVKKEGQTLYELKKRRIDFKPPDFRFLTPNNWIFLFSPNRDEYHPCKLIVENVDYTKADGKTEKIKAVDVKPVMDESLKFVYSAQQTRNALRFTTQSLLDKYMPLISVVMVGMIITVMLYAVMQFMPEVADKLVTVSANLVSAAGSCGGIPPAPPMPP